MSTTTKNQNAEQIARDQINKHLAEAGWVVQDRKAVDFNAGPGIAVREYPTAVGPADYALFANKKAVGVIEAKPADWGHKLGIAGEGLAFSNHMTRLRFNGAVEPRFAAIQLHYLWMMKYLLHRCVKHVNQASVSSREMARSVPLVVPPIQEQRRIVAKVEELFSELDKGAESLKTAREQLKPRSVFSTMPGSLEWGTYALSH